MTTPQMHIDFDLGFQSIASNVKRNFLPEEIDWILNQSIERFVKDAIKPRQQTGKAGFQDNEVDLDSIRTLLVTDFDGIIPYKAKPSDKFMSCELPGDYLHLIADRSYVLRDCNDGFAKATTFIVFNEYLYALASPETEASDPGPYFVSPDLTLNNELLDIDFPDSLEYRDYGFILVDQLKNELLGNKPVYNVYWERYKNYYIPNSFIIKAFSPLTSGGKINTFEYDGEPHNIVQINGNSEFQLQADSQLYSHVAANRLLKSDKRDMLQSSTFAKTQWKSPISGVSGNTLKIYHDNTFIVNKVDIDYIRKPQLVSLSLGYNCDLPEETHRQIVQLAVEYAKQAIQDPNYQWKLQDNQLRG